MDTRSDISCMVQKLTGANSSPAEEHHGIMKHLFRHLPRIKTYALYWKHAEARYDSADDAAAVVYWLTGCKGNSSQQVQRGARHIYIRYERQARTRVHFRRAGLAIDEYVAQYMSE
jgi:hypothetical protein